MPLVYPANENMMKLLKHPITKVGFTAMDVGVNWPDDQFTSRRIRDGDVRTEAPAAKKPPAEAPEQSSPSR